MKKLFTFIAYCGLIFFLWPICIVSGLLWEDHNNRRQGLVYLIGYPLTFVWLIILGIIPRLF